MAEEEQTATPAAADAEATPAPKRRWWRRAPLHLLAVITAVAAGLLVSFFSVDLGPSLRERAEREGSKYLQRPMRIGRLSARLVPGRFVIEDFVIEGLEPGHRPFLTAKTITVELPWWTVFRPTREILIESVEMTDWNMIIETWPSSPRYPTGRHNFPRFVPERKQPREPSRFKFTSTMKSMVSSRGTVTYEDHGTPWSIVARDMRVDVSRNFLGKDYRGRVGFANATIKIQSYQPFAANMQSRFVINGSQLHFDRIDLVSDGARSVLDGDLDMSRWPEQLYRIKSVIDIPTQKEIYFHGQDFVATGTADFEGTFHLFKGGRELKGMFSSPLVGVNAWRFPNLRGNVLWVPDRMHVTNATAAVYGGTARFDYLMAPFGRAGVPTSAAWDVEYTDVDLVQLTDFLETEGLRLAGRASGRNRLVWPLGKWAQKRGGGEVNARPPAGIAAMTRELRPEAVAAEAILPPEAGPFNSRLALGYVPIAGRVVYTLDPQWIVLDKSWAASPKTYVSFEGRTAYGERSRIPFHVTSLDWQESDRVLAGIMTAFGSPTGAIQIGGHGEFDGVMLNAFGKPRIEGTFTGDRLRAWDVVWGRGRADVIVENSYALVSRSTLAAGDSVITAAGKFSLGYPRRDGGEELNAKVTITRRPLADLRHAFELDDYAVDGLVSGEYQINGRYEMPHGTGTLLVERGVAYGEPFDSASSPLTFEGNGVRLDSYTIRKGTGTVTGSAWVAWEGEYSFNADGRRIPVESLASLSFPKAPLSGLLQFTASGTGTFEEPRWDVKARVDDLFAGDEGIGQMTGRLGLRGELLTTEFEAASRRLNVSGSGRIALTPEMDAELNVRFADTSLDPYVRFFEPRLSPFTTAVAGGTVRVVGELMDVDHLVVETKVEQLDLTLFDYPLSNKDPQTSEYRPIELSLDQHVLEILQMRLYGEGTQLQMRGSVNLHDSTLAVSASGDANLGILQGFFRNIRSSGSATLKADVIGSLTTPLFSGSAALKDGRVRHFSLPHSLEAINGTATFDAAGLRVDGITAKLAEGDVVFGGRIGLKGFAPGEISLTATGEDIRLRYPEGFRSRINTDLAVTGDLSALLLSGKVTVLDARYTRRFEPNADLFNLASSGGAAAGGAAPAPGPPVRFDVEVDAPGTLFVENNIARLVSSATLRLQGTYDRPLLFGQADIDRGDLIVEGNRYVVNRGTISFSNPTRIEPYFDFEAETRVRLPGQTYVVTINVAGSTTAPSITFNSDPPLSNVEIFSLLLGQTANFEERAGSELRGLSATESARAEEELLKLASARILGGAISAPVGRVVEQTLGLDTVQITPTFGSESDPLTPSARLIIGKRLSSRAYLTFARPLGGVSREQQIIVLEYDQSDRIGWVLTQTGDRTFAIDFRVRHTF
jgi:translocation and assembly module TamB